MKKEENVKDIKKMNETLKDCWELMKISYEKKRKINDNKIKQLPE